MGKPRIGDANTAELDTDRDRYPSFSKLLRKILEEVELPDAPVERLEVTCLASGEATYRIWSARAEEPEGGYLSKV